MKIEGKCCLVTGGAGFIGSHLVDKLVEKGCRVRVLDNLANGNIENILHHIPKKNFKFLQGCVTDPLDVWRIMDGVDIVFHLACLGVRHSLAHSFANHRANTEGTLFILDLAYMCKVEKFIYCSSSEVYGTAEYVPMPETHPTHPCTIYGASKLAGEAYVRAYYKTYGMNNVIIRPFNVYGPRSHYEGDAGEFIPKSIVRALNGKEILIYGDGSQTRDFTYVQDTIRGIIAIAECDDVKGNTYNVGNNLEISIKEMSHRILDIVGNPKASVKFTPSRPGDVLRLRADTSRVVESCGWKPNVNLEEGIQKTVDYFRNHPHGIDVLMNAEEARSWEKWEFQ